MWRRGSVGFLLALGAAACSEGIGTTPEELAWWRGERAARRALLDDYLADHADQYRAFRSGAMTSTGVPVVMFRLLPDLFPELWGSVGEDYGPVGYERDGDSVLPVGVGYTSAQIQGVSLNVTSGTCSECHLGQVRGPDGSVLPIIGGMATLDWQLKEVALIQTVASPKYQADAFRAVLDTKPPGWIYGNAALAAREAAERELFNRPGMTEAILAAVKEQVNRQAQRHGSGLAYQYSMPNAPPLLGIPGNMDLSSFLAPVVIDPASLAPQELPVWLPSLPAPAKVMPAWMIRDRVALKWDGLTLRPLWGNLAVGMVSAGDPRLVVLEVAKQVTPFVNDLPSPPYPFDVDAHSARRGQALFQAACASCHAAGNAEIYKPARVGTDANRAMAWTPAMIAGFIKLLRIACNEPAVCDDPGVGSPPDQQVFRATRGYMATALHGVWASAPYLHNGSVPTLYHLLTGDRPRQFFRGSIDYDQAKVGFVWDRWAPGAFVFDTTRAGSSNAGHDTPEFLGGIDWRNEPEKTADLLEYLKTL